ncbi:15083_t:CDS:1, partial [Acaulospora colombiana]
MSQTSTIPKSLDPSDQFPMSSISPSFRTSQRDAIQQELSAFHQQHHQ